MGANHAAAQHHHLARRHAWHTAQQNATPAIRLLQRPGPNLGCQPPRHFRHRGQQGQAATIIGDGFIGDTGDAAGQQVARLVRIGRKMQIGEQDLPVAQTLAFNGLRFLDLDDHVRRRKNLFRRGDDLCADSQVIGVGKSGTGAGIGLDHHRMAVGHRLARGIGGDADAVFLRLDLFRATDLHGVPPWKRDGPIMRYPRRDCFEITLAKAGSRGKKSGVETVYSKDCAPCQNLTRQIAGYWPRCRRMAG